MHKIIKKTPVGVRALAPWSTNRDDTSLGSRLAYIERSNHEPYPMKHEQDHAAEDNLRVNH